MSSLPLWVKIFFISYFPPHLFFPFHLFSKKLFYTLLIFQENIFTSYLFSKKLFFNKLFFLFNLFSTKQMDSFIYLIGNYFSFSTYFLQNELTIRKVIFSLIYSCFDSGKQKWATFLHQINTEKCFSFETNIENWGNYFLGTHFLWENIFPSYFK